MAGPISGSPLQTQEKSRAILIGKKDRGELSKVARAIDGVTSLAPRIEINSLNLILGQPPGRGTSAGTLHHPTLEAYCRSNPLQQQLPNPSC